MKSYRLFLRKTAVFSLALVGALFFTAAVPDVEANDWRRYDESEYLYFLYNKKSIEWLDNNTVRVRCRSTLKGEKGRNWLAEKTKIGVLPAREVENISFATFLIDIKCSNRMMREVSYNYFDKRLTLISPFDTFSSDWKFITPGSVGYKLHRVVCGPRD
ncbi:MAG: hypothetical protein EPN22_07595 [Nitrospirae bacterium]|nr:MAG: hypothetical protein EPN22_07595 [Nitrospirota bacterium]